MRLSIDLTQTSAKDRSVRRALDRMCFAANQNVLAVVSHQDDESLFCGGLLTAICDTCKLTVICMSQAKQPPAIESRNERFRRACEKVNARAVTTDFRDARHVWSHVDHFFRRRPKQIEAMRDFLREQADAIRPDMIITHNEHGEYGHCYHKVVHRVCRQAFDNDKLYFFGIGSRQQGKEQIVVSYDAEKKKQLLDCYPEFDATTFSKRFFGTVMTYQPETYIACAEHFQKPFVKRGVALAGDLTVDFLRFHVRKFLSKTGLC